MRNLISDRHPGKNERSEYLNQDQKLLMPQSFLILDSPPTADRQNDEPYSQFNKNV